MIIIGGGLAGMLAAQWFRHLSPLVYEPNPDALHNHQALLRFRTPRIGEIIGCEMKEVVVRKAVFNENFTLSSECSLLMANSYSHKVTGKFSSRSILNLNTVSRYVPADMEEFYERLAHGIDIAHQKWNIDPARLPGEQPIISTIPMQFLADHLKDLHARPRFDARPITVVRTKLSGVDLNQTFYNPWPDGDKVYRISIVGDVMIMEFAEYYPEAHILDYEYGHLNMIINFYKALIFGQDAPAHTTPVIKAQPYGKITPIDRNLRREIIRQITEQFGIYSLGRFATWRSILLDDVIRDLEVIKSLLSADKYGHILRHAASS